MLRLKRRWERSRNATVSHIPVHSVISSMHMMPNAGLLTSSIRYGVVARSLPLNGKILPGYLDASGLRVGLGVGNPNAEFTPDVSVCAVASDGGTAKILWGFQHGEVGILTAPRTIDAAKRPVSEMMRCRVGDEHFGVVLDVVWDDSTSVAVSGGADGIVKLWDAKTMQCLWTYGTEALNPDACLKVAVSVSRSLVASVTRTGDIVMCTGLHFGQTFSSAAVEEHRVPCPVMSTDSTTGPTVHVPSFIRIDAHSSTPTILIAFEDDPFFYRVSITQTGAIDITPFGDAAFGPLSSIAPFFNSTEPSFIIASDRMGWVSIYAWNAPSTTTPVHCVRKFEAHEDGAHVTALAWNGVTLITGSDRGTTHVWDGLTFEHLRSFLSPVPRIRGRGHYDGQEKEPVRQILVGPEKDMLLVNVGDRVLAWVAGPVSRTGAGGVRGRHSSGTIGKKKKDRIGIAKYLKQVELHETISESQNLLKQESEHMQMAHGRVREQYARLETMGLDEAEAVEYVLMISRDEALQRVSTQIPDMDEGVFENFDFDDPVQHSINATASSSTARDCSGTRTPKDTWSKPRVEPSPSNEKICISPLLRAESMKTGWGDNDHTQSPPESPPSSNEGHFPRMSASASPPAPMSHAWSASRSSISRTSSRGSQGSVSAQPRSTPESPQSPRSSAWTVPLRSTGSSATSVSAASSVGSNRSMGMPVQEDEEMDEELKFVLELSLAEARSRGEAL
ncbi:hypothetical protein C0991_001134 [Blastosporella zonata]|nr:hypothetical protein C0991_001134 [Blastosporella zonata]